MIKNRNRLGQIKALQNRIKIKPKPTFICSWCHKPLPLKQMETKDTWHDGKPICKHCRKRHFFNFFKHLRPK